MLFADSQGQALATPEGWLRIKRYNEGKEPVPVEKNYRIVPSPKKSNRSLPPPPFDKADNEGPNNNTDVEEEEEEEDEAVVQTVTQADDSLDGSNFWRGFACTNILQF